MALLHTTTLMVLAMCTLHAVPVIAQARRVDSMPVDTVLLDVRVGRLASATMQARRVGDVAFLPLTEVCLLVQVRCTTDPGTYASVDSIAVRLHAPVEIDWEQLTVTIAAVKSLPIVRVLDRAHRRTALHRARRDDGTENADSTQRAPAARLGYSVASPSFDIRGATLALSLNAGNTHNALESDVAITALRAAGHRISILHTWDTSGHIRQLRAGDVTSAQPYFRQLRGISITNTPVDGATYPGPVMVSGRTGPDHEVEVYRDGSLVAADSADGRGNYHVTVPVGYGTTTLTIIAYGPFGDEQRDVRRVVVPQGMLAVHTVAYSLTAGRCVQHDCRDALTMNLEFAPASRLTTGFGLAAARGPGSLTLSPAAWATTRITDAMTAFASIAGKASTLATIQIAPAADLDVMATYRSTSAPVFPSREPESDFRQEFSATTSWRTPILGQHATVVGGLSVLRTSVSSSSMMSLKAFLPTRAGYLDIFVRHTGAGSSTGSRGATTFLGADAFLVVGADRPMRGSVLRLSYERASEPDAGHAGIALSIPVIGKVALDVQGRWQNSRPHPQLLFAVRARFDEMRFRSAVDISDAGQRTVLHSIQGSVQRTRS